MSKTALKKLNTENSSVLPVVSNNGKVCEIALDSLSDSPYLRELYQEDDSTSLAISFRENGQLTPIIVEPLSERFQIISGARRVKAARSLGWSTIKAIVRQPANEDERLWWLLASNQYRQKRFSERMREADLMESLLLNEARNRSLENLGKLHKLKIYPESECLNSDTQEESVNKITIKGQKKPPQRTDARIAEAIGLGGKDIYRQARAIWSASVAGDDRARAAVNELDLGTRTIYAAFKDLRRRDHLARDFQPTPYDVWMFKHDRSYGIKYPGSIPAGILANAIHYFSEPGELVVDPMAGGGTSLDVCQSLNRRCLAYDLVPSRSDIQKWDIASQPLPEAARNCDLVFIDPPYHTMLRSNYAQASVSSLEMNAWIETMTRIYSHVYASLRPGGHIAVLIANQTEKDLPTDQGYIDHALDTLIILKQLGFLPQRRISCPMEGSYRPDQIQKSRLNKRMLGQVRDLIVARKPSL